MNHLHRTQGGGEDTAPLGRSEMVVWLFTLFAATGARAAGCGGERWCQSPEPPSQQCRDDAGPPWVDDAETFPYRRYHDSTPAVPLATGACVGCANPVHSEDPSDCVEPLMAACAEKGVKAAFLDGPVDCGRQGWFCRIYDQRGWTNPFYTDYNFAMCSTPNADEKDTDGHCHGSDADDTYGWWVRDHWFRGYAGTLHCCCGWDSLPGVVNRCDFRKSVDPLELALCRDANEQHNDAYEDGCRRHDHLPSTDPLLSTPELCWSVSSFADPESVVGSRFSFSS